MVIAFSEVSTMTMKLAIALTTVLAFHLHAAALSPPVSALRQLEAVGRGGVFGQRHEPVGESGGEGDFMMPSEVVQTVGRPGATLKQQRKANGRRAKVVEL